MLSSSQLSRFLSSSLLMAACAFTATARADGIFYEMAPPPACDSSDSSCLVIEQDQSYELSDFGKIEFVGVTEDSRCPVDVFCFWEGQVKVELKHAFPGGAEKFIVGLGGNLEATYADDQSGKTIVLEQVWPERNFANPIDKPYQIKLRLIDPVPEEDNAAQEENTAQEVIAD